jgi:hypothetical protein
MDKPTIKDLQRWLKYNIDECIRFRKKAGGEERYEDAMELKHMENTYKKVWLKLERMQE